MTTPHDPPLPWSSERYTVSAENLLNPVWQPPDFDAWADHYKPAALERFASVIKGDNEALTHLVARAVVPRLIPFDLLLQMLTYQMDDAMDYEAHKRRLAIVTVPRIWMSRAGFIDFVGDSVSIYAASFTLPRIALQEL